MSAPREEAYRETTASSAAKETVDIDGPVAEGRQSGNRFFPLRTLATYVGRLGSALWVGVPALLGGLIAVAVSALVALSTASWYGNIQIEVPGTVTSLDGGSSYITTMAWTSGEDGPLTVGTSNGFLVNVRRDGTPVLPSGTIPERYAPGSIVEIFPSDTNLASAAVWTSTTRGYAGYRLQLGATYRGFAIRVGSTLQPVMSSSATVFGNVPFVDLFRSGVRIQPVRPASPIIAGSPSWLTAINSFMIGAQPYVVAGYDSGAVLAFGYGAGVGSLQPPTKAPVLTLHSGPILAIATQTYRAETNVTFATAAADGSVVVHRLRADPPSSTARSLLFMAGGNSAQSVLYGPISRRDGLMMDRAGRVLLLWDQGGGVSISYLNANDQPYFRRYALGGIPRSTQLISTRAAQERLQALGLYDGDLDGVRGAATTAALASYRERAGLTWIKPNDLDRVLYYLVPSQWATSAVALSPRGDLFAYSGMDGVVRIVKLVPSRTAASSTEHIALLGHRALVTRIVISQDGRMLASLDGSGHLLMTNLDRLLGISSFPLATFSTAPVPEALTPLAVDLKRLAAQ